MTGTTTPAFAGVPAEWLLRPLAVALALAIVDVVPAFAPVAVLAAGVLVFARGPEADLLLGAAAAASLAGDTRPAGLLFAVAAVVAAGVGSRAAVVLGLPAASALASTALAAGLTATTAASVGVAFVAAVVASVAYTRFGRSWGERGDEEPGDTPAFRAMWLLPAALLLVRPQLVPSVPERLVDEYARGAAVAAGVILLVAVVEALGALRHGRSGTIDGRNDAGDGAGR